MNYRVGFGFDVHEFVEGRDLILGGVKIPHTAGLAGHSDADAVLHAVIDAFLGAAGCGDIGRHFPDTDDQYKNIDSRKLVRQAISTIRRLGYLVSNIDITIVAQEPHISPYSDTMRTNIADDLGISVEQVNIKATTTENLGFVGRKEGIAAWAVACIFSR